MRSPLVALLAYLDLSSVTLLVGTAFDLLRGIRVHEVSDRHAISPGDAILAIAAVVGLVPIIWLVGGCCACAWGSCARPGAAIVRRRDSWRERRGFRRPR